MTVSFVVGKSRIDRHTKHIFGSIITFIIHHGEAICIYDLALSNYAVSCCQCETERSCAKRNSETRRGGRGRRGTKEQSRVSASAYLYGEWRVYYYVVIKRQSTYNLVSPTLSLSLSLCCCIVSRSSPVLE